MSLNSRNLALMTGAAMVLTMTPQYDLPPGLAFTLRQNSPGDPKNPFNSKMSRSKSPRYKATKFGPPKLRRPKNH
jgi:hypothetical protein